MENKFVLFAIYTALIEIRLMNHEDPNNKIMDLCNLLHTLPLIIINDETGKEAYKVLRKKVEIMGMESWLSSRINEFIDRYPMFKNIVNDFER